MNQSMKLDQRISNIRLFMLDLDGTIYRGDDVIPGAIEFISRLRERKIGYVFLTNNSSKSANDYVEKLKRLSIPAGRENVFTAGQATGEYLSRKKKGGRVFVLGTQALCSELALYGLEPVAQGPADFVVAGFDTELTYAKLRIACELVDSGVEYIATNPDLVCPVKGGRSIPDCGSICYMIEQATGRRPFVIGKPRQEMIASVCGRFAVPAASAAMVGDRLYTDIVMGHQARVLTICVLSGETTREQINMSAVKPDIVFSSVDELNWFYQ